MITPTNPQPPVIRVLRGRPDREELAAVTLALLCSARARAARRADHPAGRRRAGWRLSRGYRQAGSWTF